MQESEFYCVTYKSEWMVETLSTTKSGAISKALKIVNKYCNYWKWLYDTGYRVKKVRVELIPLQKEK